jgi:arginyl-tRNA synthetase
MNGFDKGVNEKYYNELPDISQVDWSLLKEDEEWHLLKLIFSFPSMIDRSIGELHEGRLNIHLLHRYLTDIVNAFSIYYRRVKLLTEPRPQLMPTLYAKVYFLKCVRRIVNETLGLFCIDPVTFM